MWTTLTVTLNLAGTDDGQQEEGQDRLGHCYWRRVMLAREMKHEVTDDTSLTLVLNLQELQPSDDEQLDD